ncbi:MAG: hypothetical protein LBU32_26860 [Clostridiales bacterium]|nr:hypothetical protein [Clostridiales bacterium]
MVEVLWSAHQAGGCAAGASVAGGAIPLSSINETLQPRHVWKYPPQKDPAVAPDNRSATSHFIFAPALRKDIRTACKSTPSIVKILQIFAEKDVRMRGMIIRTGRSSGSFPLLRAESADFILACSKNSSSGKISAVLPVQPASGSRSPHS